MMQLDRILNNQRLVLALTGMKSAEFLSLLPSFEKELKAYSPKKNRKRKIGAGRKGALRDSRMKLLYILLYLKVYPTYDLAGFIFGVDKSRCCRWTQHLLPILAKTLGRELVLPKRHISSLEEFSKLCPGVKDLFLDGTERPVRRPQKSKLQKKQYSGKKRCHTRKNSIISDENRKILFVSPTKSGQIHDLKQIVKTNVLSHLPRNVALWVDKGFVGIQGHVRDDTDVVIPHKKPINGTLTDKQKKENKIFSSIRMTVEHAISGIKRFASTSQIYRNRKGQD